MIHVLRLLALAGALLAPAAVSARATLVAASPAEKAVVAAPRQVTLTFSEPIAAASGGRMVMTDMPGMAMAKPMVMSVAVTVAADGTTLVGTPARPLPRGAYRFDYDVVTAGGQHVTGSLSFRVR